MAIKPWGKSCVIQAARDRQVKLNFHATASFCVSRLGGRCQSQRRNQTDVRDAVRLSFQFGVVIKMKCLSRLQTKSGNPEAFAPGVISLEPSSYRLLMQEFQLSFRCLDSSSAVGPCFWWAHVGDTFRTWNSRARTKLCSTKHCQCRTSLVSSFGPPHC